MNGTKVDEFDGEYIGPRKTVFSLRTGARIEMNRGDRYRVTTNQYGNAYVNDQYVGDITDFQRTKPTT